MILLLFIITFFYVVFILILSYGFNRIPSFKISDDTQKTGFSIVIPFRNEAQNLPALLNSIQALSYPTNQFEILFVNDASSDDSMTIIERSMKAFQFDYQILNAKRNTNSPKKDAILTAIEIAKYKWILTTDADCLLPKNWLFTFSDFIQQNDCKMVIGPVNYQTKSSFLHHFQMLDFMSLQASTIGGFGIKKPFLCNGANLAYRKDVFKEVNGFEGNTQMASGDDIFLLEKIYMAYPNSVYFLKSKSAIVCTSPVNSWSGLIHQRMRWAAKSSQYQLMIGKIIGSIVFLMNLSFLIALFSMIWSEQYSFFYLLLIVIKICVDFSLLEKASIFYNGYKKMKDYELSSLLYPFFSTYVVLKSLLGKYEWKEREFRK